MTKRIQEGMDERERLRVAQGTESNARMIAKAEQRIAEVGIAEVEQGIAKVEQGIERSAQGIAELREAIDGLLRRQALRLVEMDKNDRALEEAGRKLNELQFKIRNIYRVEFQRKRK